MSSLHRSLSQPPVAAAATWILPNCSMLRSDDASVTVISLMLDCKAASFLSSLASFVSPATSSTMVVTSVLSGKAMDMELINCAKLCKSSGLLGLCMTPSCCSFTAAMFSA